MPPQEQAAFSEQFQSLHSSISGYLNELINLEPIRPLRLLLVISTLARAALIRLHEKFITVDTLSKETCLSAANGILTLLQQVNISEFKYIDPIMAVSQRFVVIIHSSPRGLQVLLTTAGRVYMVEVSRYKSSVKGQPSPEDRTYVGSLMSSAQQLLTFMTEFGSICPLLGLWPYLLMLNNGYSMHPKYTVNRAAQLRNALTSA